MSIDQTIILSIVRCCFTLQLVGIMAGVYVFVVHNDLLNSFLFRFSRGENSERGTTRITDTVVDLQNITRLSKRLTDEK